MGAVLVQEVPAAVADVAGEQLVVAHAEDPRGGVVGVDGAAVEVENEHALGKHLGRDIHPVLQCAQLAAPSSQLAAQALGGGDRLHEALAGQVEGAIGVGRPDLGDLTQRVGDRARGGVRQPFRLLHGRVRDRGSIHQWIHRLSATIT